MAEEEVSVCRVCYSEMGEEDQKSTQDICIEALRAQEKSDVTMYQKDVAAMIKKELDSSRGGTWNVVVGQSFGSYVSHETKTMSQFFIGNIAFLIWKHG
jgi:dynein light chain LC8-type